MNINGKKSEKNNKNNKLNKLLSFSKYPLKYISILTFILFIYKIHFRIVSKLIIESGKKYIFTYWEPHYKIPGYLRLCILTWKKFLPEYDIKILDYYGVKQYLGESLFSKILYKNPSRSVQADAFRVALLKKYGGIWMDTDTIVLGREFLKQLKDSELVMFGDEKNKTQHIGFIFASNNSIMINEWMKQIIKNVKEYRNFLSMKKNLSDVNWKKESEKVNFWNFLGNGIIDPLLKNITDNKLYLRLDKYKTNIFPELKYFENISMKNEEKYRAFYFQKAEPKNRINNHSGIILLHNSWTPKIYRKMTAKRFLKNDILLSKLLSQILNKRI